MGSKRRVRVQVTALDIRRGFRGSACHCPMARALRRAFGYRRVVKVGVHYLWIGARRLYHTDQTRRFIDRYDDERRVRPIVFTLELLPAPSPGEG
jgi:hypothetical protein